MNHKTMMSPNTVTSAPSRSARACLRFLGRGAFPSRFGPDELTHSDGSTKRATFLEMIRWKMRISHCNDAAPGAFCQHDKQLSSKFLHQKTVSLAQLGERQTEVSVTKSGGIVFDPRRGQSPCLSSLKNIRTILFANLLLFQRASPLSRRSGYRVEGGLGE